MAYRLPCGCVDHQHFGVGHTVVFCPEGARLLAAADAAAEAANADESGSLSEAEEDALAACRRGRGGQRVRLW